MTDMSAKYKEYMEGLSDTALLKIVEEDSSDYENTALEAAKQELERRKVSGKFIHSDDEIFTTDKFGRVKLADIFSKADVDKVLGIISGLTLNAAGNVDSYREVLNQLNNVEPAAANEIELNFCKNANGEWDIVGNYHDSSDSFGVEFYPWSEWLAFYVYKDEILEYGKDNIAALILYKMTINGFTEDEIEQKLMEFQGENGEMDNYKWVQLEPALALNQNMKTDNAIAEGIEKLKKGISLCNEVPQIRPWVRFLARSADNTLWLYLIYIIWNFIDPASYNYFIKAVTFISIFPFFWCFIEALLLSTLGTTPGKWLLQVYITDENGERLSFKRALYRSLFVWSCGNACQIKYVNILTNLISYYQLTNKGATWWDAIGKFKVSHKRIGTGRALAAAGIILLLPVADYLLNILSK